MRNVKCYLEIINRNPKIDVLRIFRFSSNNKVQDRERNSSNRNMGIINRALYEKERKGSSFWESLFSLAEGGEVLDKCFMKNALFHNKNETYTHLTKVDFLNFISSDIHEDVAINSKVILSDGSERHIPMLDFKIKSNNQNLKVVKDVLHILGLKGYIFDSGKSYHFVGYNLITESELLDLLAYFILLQPISDKAWATHQILERSASLRLSKKYGQYPELIECIN